jgi:hypothetical protein
MLSAPEPRTCGNVAFSPLSKFVALIVSTIDTPTSA